jgi:hypothetical protein
MQLPLQLGAMYCLLQLKFLCDLSKALRPCNKLHVVIMIKT